MRELTVDEFVSLDGFAADASGDPDFALGYDGPEFARWEQQVLDEPQVIVLGRTTYQDMSGVLSLRYRADRGRHERPSQARLLPHP